MRNMTSELENCRFPTAQTVQEWENWNFLRMALSKPEDPTKEGLQSLEESLSNIFIDMRLFSLGMRSLYAEKAVRGTSNVAQDFRKLRDKTRDDAMIYLKGVLPVATNFVSSISEYFEFDLALKYDEWKDMLGDIQQEITSYKGLATTLAGMHEDILVPLKKRQDEARIIVKEFTGLQQKFEEQKREYERSASSKRSWAVALMFVPAIGPIAKVILDSKADEDDAEAVAKSEESKISAEASIAVSESLIPALCNFINGLEKIARFFNALKLELGKFEGKAGKAIEDTKKLHYAVMRSEAKKMDALCTKFYAVIPAVRTDFLAIPTEGTDQSYVDKWLRQQKKAIRENVGRKLADLVMKAIASSPDSD